MKESIKKFARKEGADDVGVASIQNYNSPNSTPIKEIFPSAKTLVVLAFQQVDNMESEVESVSSLGMKTLNEFTNSVTYKTARFIKNEFNGKAISIPSVSLVEINKNSGLPYGAVSLRHAAVAAGLGNFGKHNLVLHPEIGSKVLFTAIITDLEILADSPLVDRICVDCDICINKCPVSALDEKNKTDVSLCASNSQPYGFVGYLKFWKEYTTCSSEDKELMIHDKKFQKLHQALSMGSQYVCFNCIKDCPVGNRSN